MKTKKQPPMRSKTIYSDGREDHRSEETTPDSTSPIYDQEFLAAAHSAFERSVFT